MSDILPWEGAQVRETLNLIGETFRTFSERRDTETVLTLLSGSYCGNT